MSVTIKKKYGRELKEHTLYTKEELDSMFGGSIIQAGESVGRTAELQERLDSLNLDLLPELESRLDALEADLNDLNTVILPGLQNDLDALEADLNNLNTVVIPALQDDLDNLNTIVIPGLQDDLDNLQVDLGNINDVEIVSTLPTTNLFEGRLVFLTTDDKLYRYNGTEWTSAVPAIDITGTITEVQIGDDSISTPKLQANSITAAKIEALTITANQIASNAITSDKIIAGAISTAKLDANVVTAAKIAANTITANQIATGTITALEIAANTITANEIAVGTITANEIAANVITANEIASGTITASEIGANVITANEINVSNLVTNTTFTNELVANQTFTDTLVANTVFTDALVANQAFIDELVANTAFIGDIFATNVSVTGTLTLTGTGELSNATDDYILNENGLQIFGSTSAGGVLGSVPRALRIGNNNGTAVPFQMWVDSFVSDVNELVLENATRMRVEFPSEFQSIEAKEYIDVPFVSSPPAAPPVDRARIYGYNDGLGQNPNRVFVKFSSGNTVIIASD